MKERRKRQALEHRTKELERLSRQAVKHYDARLIEMASEVHEHNVEIKIIALTFLVKSY